LFGVNTQLSIYVVQFILDEPLKS